MSKFFLMSKYLPYLIILVFLTLAFTLSEAVSAQNPYKKQTIYPHICSLIKKHINEAESLHQLTIRGKSLYTFSILETFYKRNNFQPVWVLNNTRLEQAQHLIDTIESAYLEGLTPEHYHLRTIKDLLKEVKETERWKKMQNPETLVDLDLLLTDAFHLLSCHFSAGCVNPVTLKAEWFTMRGKVDTISIFEMALKENRIKETLQSLLPPQDSYAKLRQALQVYRKIVLKGGWPVISEGSSLKTGVKDARIIDLKKRLIVSGYLPTDMGDPQDIFNTELESAVKKFQLLHGLDVDGIVGPKTLKALNVSAKKRTRQIELNLERMRWTFRNLGKRYIIIVNIADFTLDVIENNQTILSMKVVVGKPFWHTPVFSEKMTYMVLNPSWNVPHSIAVEELIPKIKNDPDYLVKHNIKILKDWSKNAEEIDSNTIDWSFLDAQSFRYRFRQESGPLNPLGRIKFMFPNEFGVYFHDTPSKGHFLKSVRSFSHGCIRLEKPIDLAEYVLKGAPNWTREKILAEIQTGKEREVMLPEPINIHILYLTAWVDDDGALHFRDDIYGRDEHLDKSLREHPPRTLKEEIKLDSKYY